MNAAKVILLLGRRDRPTDGVADYCEKLCEAGPRRGVSFETVSVPWAERGWNPGFAELRKAATAWRDRWVLLQYTTLAWSRRGFPLRAPQVFEVLRECGARPGVVFHDFLPARGSNLIGRARAYCQLRVLRRLYARSDLGVFTVPTEKIFWVPQHSDKAAFIPVGANCLEGTSGPREDSATRTVAVYSVTGGSRTAVEVKDIASALTQAGRSVGPIRLILFGRGSKEAEPFLRAELAGAEVQIESLGLLSPAEVQQALSRADVLLFVRGQISSRRGSAIAGLASGLPIVCYSGPETAWPITEAGIIAVPAEDRLALAAALENVLRDAALRRTLAERSRQTFETYFSWSAITARFAEALHLGDPIPGTQKSKESRAAVRI